MSSEFLSLSYKVFLRTVANTVSHVQIPGIVGLRCQPRILPPPGGVGTLGTPMPSATEETRRRRSRTPRTTAKKGRGRDIGFLTHRHRLQLLKRGVSVLKCQKTRRPGIGVLGHPVLKMEMRHRRSQTPASKITTEVMCWSSQTLVSKIDESLAFSDTSHKNEDEETRHSGTMETSWYFLMPVSNRCG